MTENLDPNLQVTEALKTYIDLSIAPLYALMLDGPWGSGKTHYVKEIIKLIDFESRKVIHISLYGLTSSAQIDEKIFQNLHPFLSSGKVKAAGKILASVASIALKYDISTGDVGGELKVGIPKFNAEDFLSKDVDHIMFFDDFERCLIDPKILLGYINYFVEQVGLKVILAANESEILKKHKTEYLNIKEKVVGVTFKIKPNLDSAIKFFITELTPASFSKLIENSTHIIYDSFQKIDYGNLRSLRQVLIQFQSIYKIMPESAKANNDFFNEFIKLYLIIALENSNCLLNKEELESIPKGKSLLSYMTELDTKKDEVEIKSREDLLGEKHAWVQYLNISKQSTAFWVNLFIDKNINENLLIELVSSHPSFLNPNNEKPNWIKLWWWQKLKQYEYDEILNTVLEELENNKLGNIYEVMHACCIIAELIEKNLITKFDAKTWLSKSKMYFHKLSGPDHFPNIHNSGHDYLEFYMGYAGLGYPESKVYFKEFCTYANEVYKQEFTRIAELKSEELILSFKESLDAFVKFIETNMDTYPRYSFFDNINVEKLLIEVEKFSTVEDWRIFAKTIKNWFDQNREFSSKHLYDSLSQYVKKRLNDTEGKIIHEGVKILDGLIHK